MGSILVGAPRATFGSNPSFDGAEAEVGLIAVTGCSRPLRGSGGALRSSAPGSISSQRHRVGVWLDLAVVDTTAHPVDAGHMP